MVAVASKVLDLDFSIGEGFANERLKFGRLHCHRMSLKKLRFQSSIPWRMALHAAFGNCMTITKVLIGPCALFRHQGGSGGWTV